MTQSPSGKRTQKCTKTNTLFCVYREGFCPLFLEKRDTLSVSINGEENGMLLYREAVGESVSLSHREEGDSERGQSTTLLYLEEADSFTIRRRECLSPYKEE